MNFQHSLIGGVMYVICSNPKFADNHLLIPPLYTVAACGRRREPSDDTGNTLSVACPSRPGWAAWTPSACSYPEPLVSKDVPEARVPGPWLCDRTSPCATLGAGDVSIANLWFL